MRVAALVLAIAMTSGLAAQVKKENFGKTAKGKAVDVYVLNSGDIEARIISYGAILQSLRVPDRNGKTADIVLGFDSLGDYETKNSPYIGAIIGRYANRVAGGKFTLDGKTFTLPLNDGPDPQHHVNTLHGGLVGFDKAVWESKEIPHGVELTHVSADGDQGFPGKLTVVVRYTLIGRDLKIEYSATTDKDTVLNLTNHSYFNLAGQGNGDILQNEVKMNASHYTPVNGNLIPTGELASVSGTPFDFRKAAAVGARINDDNDQLKKGHGYDHNWVLENGGKLAEAAEVYEPSSGRVLQVLTDQPGIQFYTANFLDGTITGKDGKVYQRRGALCLETQRFPDSPNHPKFPTGELKAGQTFRSVTIFRVSAR